MVYKVEVSGEASSGSAAGYLCLPQGRRVVCYPVRQANFVLSCLRYAPSLPFPFSHLEYCYLLRASTKLVGRLLSRTAIALSLSFFFTLKTDQNLGRLAHIAFVLMYGRGNRMESASVVDYSIGML